MLFEYKKAGSFYQKVIIAKFKHKNKYIQKNFIAQIVDKSFKAS